MTTAERIKRANDEIARHTREVVESGYACCGSGYWTEYTLHEEHCNGSKPCFVCGYVNAGHTCCP